MEAASGRVLSLTGLSTFSLKFFRSFFFPRAFSKRRRELGGSSNRLGGGGVPIRCVSGGNPRGSGSRSSTIVGGVGGLIGDGGLTIGSGSSTGLDGLLGTAGSLMSGEVKTPRMVLGGLGGGSIGLKFVGVGGSSTDTRGGVSSPGLGGVLGS